MVFALQRSNVFDVLATITGPEMEIAEIGA
jgi:hypothetical protein